MKLSNAQQVFLHKLNTDQVVTRQVLNRTGNSLKNAGLVKHAVGIGWWLTAEGRAIAEEITIRFKQEVYEAYHG